MLAVILVLCIAGCGDFFSQKPAELQTQAILNELKQIKDNPNIANPLPEMYRGPAKRMSFMDGIKLSYFTKHHSVEKLADMINTQFAEMTNDDKGNTYYKPDYIVTKNPATNQLIINCPNDEEADKLLEFLEMVDVPPIQVNIDCIVIEQFADVTMDWETTIKIENMLGEKITLGGKTDAVTGELLPAFPGASLRESKRSTFGLDVGFWRNQGVKGHEFRAVVDMLISRGYLKILMNPTLETVNGQKAKITSRDNVPIEKIVTTRDVNPYSITEYQWVEDALEVTPHVYADGSIGLATRITLGSRSKPEGVVQASIITERYVEIAENRIAPGESLIIGGLKKTEERAVIRGIPFLKDIPILQILFSSKDFEEKSNEVIFILTPSISSGSVKYSDMIEYVRQKQAPPEYKVGLEQVLTDPFGAGYYTDYIEREAAKAKFERLKAEIEKAEALHEVDRAKEKLLEAADEVLIEKTKALKANAVARAAEEKAKKATDKARKAEKEARKAKKEAEIAKRETEKAIAEAQKTLTEVDKAKQQDQ